LNQKYRYMSVQYDGFAVQTPNAPPDVFVDDNTGDDQFPPTLPTTVILDSGAPYTTMPSEHLGWLSAAIGGSSRRAGLNVVDCAARGWTGGVDFSFAGVPIRVPFLNSSHGVPITRTCVTSQCQPTMMANIFLAPTFSATHLLFLTWPQSRSPSDRHSHSQSPNCAERGSELADRSIRASQATIPWDWMGVREDYSRVFQLMCLSIMSGGEVCLCIYGWALYR
jgi:Eukaryotic aspartyl protease